MDPEDEGTWTDYVADGSIHATQNHHFGWILGTNLAAFLLLVLLIIFAIAFRRRMR